VNERGWDGLLKEGTKGREESDLDLCHCDGEKEKEVEEIENGE
jgi:hypothetical protein